MQYAVNLFDRDLEPIWLRRIRLAKDVQQASSSQMSEGITYRDG